MQRYSSYYRWLGRVSSEKGLGKNYNPYPPRSTRHEEWNVGWEAADRERLAQKTRAQAAS